MGADLSQGCALNGLLHCPLHDWRYEGDGRCAGIPAADRVPPFARQARYPTAEIGGHVVFSNAPSAPYPVPFYDGASPDALLPAAPFEFVVNTPWYMIGANAFDLQHFRIAHDRTLLGSPVIESPSPFARRITATYDVSGKSWRDRLTRRFSGEQVVMSVTVWGGVNMLVTARFRRTTSYGMVFVRPLDSDRTHLRSIVWVPRRRAALARVVLDPLDARVRRHFIRAFVMEDATRSDGVRYNPATLIEADAEMRRYFQWLAGVCPGDTTRGEHDAQHDGRDRDVLPHNDHRAVLGANHESGAGDAGGGSHDRRPDAGHQPAPPGAD
jgi:phenylpropionate dioxygenase-like ring-hydroxylating dioxygenase large terminal subunit